MNNKKLKIYGLYSPPEIKVEILKREKYNRIPSL
jgi:hypothetical protein